MSREFPLRSLGRDGPKVTAVGLGLMSLGGIYGDQDSLEYKVSFLDHAHAIGQRFWDTADMYLDSEDAVGEWVKRSHKRDDIFLATKFACQFDLTTKSMKVRSDPQYVHEACEKSLKRLNVDTIDLYYCHRIDGVTPIERTIEAMVELKNQGKIRYLGLSEVSAATLRRAHAVHPITAYQIEYSPFATDIERPTIDLLNTCRELGIAVVAYSPVGRGVLSGQIKSADDIAENDFRKTLPKYSAENFPNILKLANGFEKVAQAHGYTSAQVAIAWLLAQGPDIIPIPGTRSTARIEENTAASLVKLTDEELKELRELVDKTEIPGERYHASMSATTLRDSVPLK
ncbi:NADP-dependent oxidoreductase domain-containing protein [Penicillium chermesinum]|uniref:NADP-dependent oxidoreductase domain-containing protein n=1 Tax=Penicillium chermesinum TaxID=63820 RepID=A0A9W9TJM0_9EURO|nr:NADP-dependent oxidoreductase domain-containing protein [Penicillium chermesinum]KAJ5225201.1 NADP-dependent oxidoreductase domain-containing protein [Penicillium chermesinum]KAJ6140515.1 NADP-dependent oxidoreductase domain-containing protein [Penicillium chermesinum]